MTMGTMISVLHSPTKTFEYIREKGGHFAIPFIILIVLVTLSTILLLPMIESSIEAQNPDNADVDIELVKQIGKITAVVFGSVGTAFTVFITALLLLLLNLIVRGEATYMQLAKVAVFSSIPGMINSLISGILARVTDAQSEKDILLSLGAFVEEKEGLVYGLANMINPFSLWGLALLIIGSAVMCRRPNKTVGLWIGTVWVVSSLIFALLA